MQHQFMVDKAGQLVHVIDNEVRAIVAQDQLATYVKGQSFDAQLAYQRVQEELDAQRKQAQASAAEQLRAQTAGVEALVAKLVAEQLAKMGTPAP
jgi:hypothetical protein